MRSVMCSGKPKVFAYSDIVFRSYGYNSPNPGNRLNKVRTNNEKY
jgi:hypothetical protein